LHRVQSIQHLGVVGQEVLSVRSDEIGCASLGGLIVQHDLMASTGSTLARNGAICHLHPGSINHHTLNRLLRLWLATSRIVSTRLSLDGRPALGFPVLLLGLHLRGLGLPHFLGLLFSLLGPVLSLSSLISIFLSIRGTAMLLLR
jgi:hypothetical protein